jgi:hypothetical protein
MKYRVLYTRQPRCLVKLTKEFNEQVGGTIIRLSNNLDLRNAPTGLVMIDGTSHR